MPAKHLVIGLDGADVDVVMAMGARTLPNLFAQMSRGAWARLQSVQPPATLPNWTTFLTGTDPGRHGVFDFTTREGYAVRFTAGSVREAPTIASRLDRLGLACACIGFPATYPPERLEHGVFVSGWDAPVAFEADASFVWPPSLHGEMKLRFGATRFDDVDEFDADAPGWHERLPEALEARIARKVEFARWLLEARDWDLFAIYFGESDTAAHHLWAHHDAASPRHPHGHASDGLTRVYQALDRAVGDLAIEAGDETELTVVSDHGSGGASDVVLYLNRALAEAGLLTFHEPRTSQALAGRLKDLALTLLPGPAREKLFQAFDARLPSLLESKVRFGNIDMARTRAFSDELNYFPGVWLNLAGRDPEGTVLERERAQATREVERALLALRDPLDGRPVVETVWRREELYEGPYVERAPDLLLRLHLRDGYSYNLMPSGTAPPLTGPWRRLTPDEHLGRKGRSLPGSHRERGLYIATGPRVSAVGEIDAAIADATATLLARMDIALPSDASGRVLFEVLLDGGAPATSLPDVPVTRAPSGPSGEAEVERRLRALGYVD